MQFGTIIEGMDLYLQPDAFSAKQVLGGVMITFSDCIGDFYPASMLHASLDPDASTASDLPPTIVSIDRIHNGTLMVEFSDGTVAFYGVDELLRLRPDRIKPISQISP